jgi:hypothetical protein
MIASGSEVQTNGLGLNRAAAPARATNRQIEMRCRRSATKTMSASTAFGFLRRYNITHAAAYDGGQLGAVLDRDNTASDVWADTAYRSAANLALLDRRGLKPQFQRKKPRGKKMPTRIVRGNATRARV